MTPRVLVVEDDEVDRENVRRLLRRWYRIEQAPDAEAALAALEGEPPDCVLLDANLPDADGVELVRRMAPLVAVVVVTGMDDDRHALAALRAGAHDYVTKNGLEARRLRLTVHNAIERARLTRQVADQQAELAQRAAELEVANRALLDRERRLALLLSRMPALVWTVDLDLHLVNVAGGLVEGADNLVADTGLPVEVLADNPDDGQTVRGAHRKALGGRAATFTFQRAGRAFEAQVEPVRGDGGEGGDGELTGLVGVAVDVTRSKARERVVRQSEAMDAVARFADVVANDFNNALAAIVTATSLLQAELSPEDPLAEDVSLIADRAWRAAMLTRKLLGFCGRRPAADGATPTGPVLLELLQLVDRMVGSDIDVDALLPPDLWPVTLEVDDLEQIVLQLVENGREAMPGGGRLHIEAANTTVDAEEGAAGALLDPGDYVRLTIRDDGTGMSSEVRSRAFEPFFTTRGDAKGAGMGLTRCYGLARRAGGLVRLESTPGEGTTVRVWLPRATAETAEAPAEVPPLQARQPRARPWTPSLLVVEDDGALRITMGRLLQRRGYAVVLAADAAEAWSWFDRQADAFDAVLTDVIMPGERGDVLARRMLARRPDLPVIVMSGNLPGDLMLPEAAQGRLRLLRKPFPMRHLLDVLAEMLGQGPPGAAN